ncbi:MAG: N-6 DNA methylase [Melioribacteraceae bacterium]|nr:N-6 DNA methylase [Melioribacteraceae bacterium]
MNISRNIPIELKTFFKLFEQLAYRHQYSTVFDDYLTMCIYNFSYDNQEYKKLRDERMNNYEKKEHDLFNQLFFEMLKVLNDQLGSGMMKWYDFFGCMYEAIISTHKSQAMGQFFTPVHVVDAMVLMNSIEKDSAVNDPTCGSGRMLIASHVHSGGCYVYGQDLDLMCCKMSVLNMAFHGCNGEIVWQDSLNLNDYRKGWRIRPNYFVGLCFIEDLPKEESYIWSVNQNYKLRYLKENDQEKRKEIQEQFPTTLFPAYQEEIRIIKKPSVLKTRPQIKIEEPTLF